MTPRMIEIEGLDGPIKIVFEDSHGLGTFLLQVGPVAAALITAVVGFLVYRLHSRQHWLEGQRFRYSIRERQYVVYEAIRDGIHDVLRLTANSSEEEIKRVLASVLKVWPDANFLFGREVSEFFEAAHWEMTHVANALFEFKVIKSGTGYDDISKRYFDARSALENKRDSVLALFRPYLELAPQLMQPVQEQSRWRTILPFKKRRPRSPSGSPPRPPR